MTATSVKEEDKVALVGMRVNYATPSGVVKNKNARLRIIRSPLAGLKRVF